MKYYQIKNLNYTIDSSDLANIFNIYDEDKLGNNFKTFNINKTLNFIGIDNISTSSYYNYVVKEGESWSLISYRNYGTTRLWWVICKLNKITNPSVSPEVGQIVKILNKDYVRSILEKIKKD